MRDGSFSIGDFALFVSYLYMVGWLNSEIGGVLAEYRQTGVSFDRLRGLIPSASPGRLVQHQRAYLAGDLPDVPFSTKTDAHRLDLVQAEGLTYHYGDNGRGIDNISLRVPRGSLTVVTGRIGSGKTTLLRVLLGLLTKDAGVVRWNGEPVDDLATFFVPPRSAYTSQVPRLFSEPLRDNILLGLPENKIDLNAALNAAVMEQDVRELTDGLDTVVGARGVKLSGGQLRRSAAARMFVRDPELLVFDDLSSGLDVDTEQQLWDRLFQRPEATALVVSHRRAALRRADHVIVLKEAPVAASKPKATSPTSSIPPTKCAASGQAKLKCARRSLLVAHPWKVQDIRREFEESENTAGPYISPPARRRPESPSLTQPAPRSDRPDRSPVELGPVKIDAALLQTPGYRPTSLRDRWQTGRPALLRHG